MSATSPHVPESKAPDQMIMGKVRAALAESADVNIQSVTVQSVQGTVRLAGMVNTLREKNAAGRISMRIVGAGRVENDLTVAMDRSLTDPDIFRLVEQALGNYPDYDPTEIGVHRVQDGVVFLTGAVPSLKVALGAVDIASGIEGVRSIVNEIDIAAGTPFDDIRLGNKVMDVLSDDPRIDPFNIRVHAESGQVYIEGEVRDREAVDATVELASAVPGVRRIVNALHVRKAA